MQISREQARALGIKLPSSAKRAKKPAPPDSYVPHDCVILAIDPGNVSGYAIVTPLSSKNGSVYSGQTAEGQARVVVLAKEAALAQVRPLVVVGETWTTGDRVHDRRMHAAVLLGLGAAWERWRLAFDAVGLPKSRVIRVNTATWRSKVIGGPMNRTTAEWKGLARLHAEGRFRKRRELDGLVPRPLGDDEAEALCIAAWAMHAGAVGEAVKKAGKRYP